MDLKITEIAVAGGEKSVLRDWIVQTALVQKHLRYSPLKTRLSYGELHKRAGGELALLSCRIQVLVASTWCFQTQMLTHTGEIAIGIRKESVWVGWARGGGGLGFIRATTPTHLSYQAKQINIDKWDVGIGVRDDVHDFYFYFSTQKSHTSNDTRRKPSGKVV
jgi:hypothetical protein